MRYVKSLNDLQVVLQIAEIIFYLLDANAPQRESSLSKLPSLDPNVYPRPFHEALTA